MLKLNEKLSVMDLKKGKWNLIRSTFDLSEQENVPSHYGVKPEDEKVTVMTVFAPDEITTEDLNEWYMFSYPDTVVIHEDIFMFSEELAGYVLGTISVETLVNLDYSENSKLIHNILHDSTTHQKYPNIEELRSLVSEQTLSEEEIKNVFADVFEKPDTGSVE